MFKGVCPAPAGVIPQHYPNLTITTSMPRTCGGDPEDCLEGMKRIAYAPHLRG